MADGLVEDIRVPIFQGTIPFIYLKYRPVGQRLVDRAHSNSKVLLAEVHERLSQEEITKIATFTHEFRIGLWGN